MMPSFGASMTATMECAGFVSEILSLRSTRKIRLSHTATHRICCLCRRTLPNCGFTRRSTGTYLSACKDCNRHVFAQRRRARLKNVGGSYTTDEWHAHSLSTTDVLCASECGTKSHRERVAGQSPQSSTSGRCRGAVQTISTTSSLSASGPVVRAPHWPRCTCHVTGGRRSRPRPC